MQKKAVTEAVTEALLEGWLAMSMSIWNERLVSAMTYNESLVCNQLYKRQKYGAPPLTATDLCGLLRLHKPQMNVILNRLEKNGIIVRVRSGKDRRSVNIMLTEKGKPLYEKAHEEILRLPQALVDRLGAEKMQAFADTMQEVAACFCDVLNQEEGKRRSRMEEIE